ncbi:YVTN family beta-propeller protein [Clostridium acetobutylicum]|uniref:YNCE-like beta-propeller domain-containing protein n=1 Tax=Clostridium acetobutylicum (strain ATCC 824 / DSM 792 / JCM 1419 / IAM 19013 / LMG 5710 / NBRC 13948 / NRRL B-527 / VKM B-1787 / 2291 / W) TaxID=272562 RepID=Q97G36_CLOAB|nr:MULTISPECIES: YncE family protein [Clostridium]AAK80487.1 Predicted protein of beta-propeller fold [Clostridium acetobutylicum ATCC 824]ADZ21585.1 protein of beta-propeller fold protein [Clostridium acetobutylicum EA 2018]AEI32417.1 beta-propeller fold protein [Clostridium acetobutylicum DSM 1731]AWV79096.1 YncE family protein [Clostridium acetobutylicum]MBC2394943.1 YncE family protein [Clostridium acetobutylicum]
MLKKYLKFISLSLVIALVTVGCSQNQAPQTTPKSSRSANKIIPCVFTANEKGSISKVSTLTNKVVDTIRIRGKAHNVQISPDKKILGVTNILPESNSNDKTMKNMVSNGYAVFYNADTDALVKKVQVGAHPAHIDFTGDGKNVLVTNNMSNNISVISTSDYKVKKTIGVGNGPHGFRISKDNKFAYVANMGEDTVSVVDIAAGKELRKVKVGNTPITTAVTSDGNTLLATVNSENALAIVNLSTDSVVKVFVGAGPAQVYLSPDDKYAFVANQGTETKPSNTVTKIDIQNKTVAATITVGKGAHGVVVSDDNKFTYVTNMYDNTVSVINNANDKIVSTITVGGVPNGITFKK